MASENPPFTPFGDHCELVSPDVVPIHDPAALIYPTDWWACTEPERPMDYAVLIDWRCPKCKLKATIELATVADHPMRTHNPLEPGFSLSQVLEFVNGLVDG